MKTLIILITLIMFCSCEEHEQNNFTYETLLVDITDVDDSIHSSALDPYGSVKGNDGICLSLAFITDVYNNNKHTICLDSFSDGMMANIVERNHDTRAFNEQRMALFARVDSVSYDHEESHVLRSVCRELAVLSQKPFGAKKRLVVFSNLFENTKEFSFFSTEGTRALKDPEELAAFFENEYDVPDNLQGITLEIRYEPTRHSEALHNQLIELYRILFEPRGCLIVTHHEQITHI